MFFLVQSLISSNRIVQVRSEICIPQVWQTCILGTVDFLRLLISQEAALAKAAGNVMPVGWYPHVRSKLCVYSCFASLIAVSMCSLPHLFFFSFQLRCLPTAWQVAFVLFCLLSGGSRNVKFVSSLLCGKPFPFLLCISWFYWNLAFFVVNRVWLYKTALFHSYQTNAQTEIQTNVRADI